MGAMARIEEINFPTALNTGDPIEGTIVLKNVGDETASVESGLLAVLITTLWDGKEHTSIAYASINPGETFTFDFRAPRGTGTMPDGNAVLEVAGRIWLGWDGGWRVDDVKSWIIYLGEAPPPQEPVQLLPIIVSLLTGVVLIGLCLIEPRR